MSNETMERRQKCEQAVTGRGILGGWMLGALGALVVMLGSPGVAMANQQQAPGLVGSGTLRLGGITGILGDVVDFLTGPFLIATSIIGLIAMAVTYQLADDGNPYKKAGRYLIATMVALTGVQIVMSMASGATF